MRVAMVCGYRPTPAGGGTERYVYELTQGLLRRGLHVDIICEDQPFLPDSNNPLAAHIIGLAPESLDGRTLPEQFRRKSQRLAELIDPSEYDLVHLHGQYGFHTALRWAELARRPALVSTFHLTAVGPNERYRQLGLPQPQEAPVDSAVTFMEETIGRLSDKCIAVSHGVAQELAELYSVPADKVEVISNWYDANVFRPFEGALARRQLGLDAQARYLLYVGHFNMSRGKIMAQAMRQLPPDITLLVVHHEKDPAIASEFRDRVHFTGHLAPETLALHYSAADLLCFPSLYGGFGLVLVEAMACGCPPVVFDCAAMNEVVTQSSGYLVAEPTAAAYAATIMRALQDQREKGAGARRRARAFNMSTQIDAVLHLYRKVMWPVTPFSTAASAKDGSSAR